MAHRRGFRRCGRHDQGSPFCPAKSCRRTVFVTITQERLAAGMTPPHTSGPQTLHGEVLVQTEGNEVFVHAYKASPCLFDRRCNAVDGRGCERVNHALYSATIRSFRNGNCWTRIHESDADDGVPDISAPIGSGTTLMTANGTIPAKGQSALTLDQIFPGASEPL